jgi:hypothetical protein
MRGNLQHHRPDDDNWTGSWEMAFISRYVLKDCLMLVHQASQKVSGVRGVKERRMCA